jgi:hypothetical protein
MLGIHLNSISAKKHNMENIIEKTQTNNKRRFYSTARYTYIKKHFGSGEFLLFGLI